MNACDAKEKRGWLRRTLVVCSRDCVWGVQRDGDVLRRLFKVAPLGDVLDRGGADGQ